MPATYQLNEAHPRRISPLKLWGFQLPEHKPVVPILGSIMHNLPDSKNRANLRSVTPAGFACTVFEDNYQVSLANHVVS
jgi:hypothetical protein